MKQQLWILNSSLLVIFFVSLILGVLIKQTPPPFRIRKPFIPQATIEKEAKIQGIENIYKYDLFGTFVKKESPPTSKSLVSPMPEPKSITTAPPPEIPKPEFLPPLPVTLKGIAFSFDEEKSISMLEDETKKEHIYHVGDVVKDAQVIKIARNRIILLRTNGQHETIYLRKEDKPKELPKEKAFEHIIKKINDSTFEIDITRFPQEITSLGMLTQSLSFFTAYKQGKPIGIKIDPIPNTHISKALGLEKGDIITSINNISTAEKKNRINIYDQITNAKKDDTVSVILQRNSQEKTIEYKLTNIEYKKRREFIPEPATEPEKTDDKQPEGLKLSKLQEREKRIRDFQKQHQGPQQTTIEQIRKRLLDNLRARSRNARIR